MCLVVLHGGKREPENKNFKKEREGFMLKASLEKRYFCNFASSAHGWCNNSDGGAPFFNQKQGCVNTVIEN